MTFTAERLVPGRRQGTRCAAPTRRNRRARRCLRAQPAGGGVRLALPAGDSVLGFSGRLFEVLGPGSYRLVAVARDSAGNRSPARRTGFTLLRASRRAQ